MNRPTTGRPPPPGTRLVAQREAPVRATPEATGMALGSLSQGEEVTVESASQQPPYVRVRGRVSGYVDLRLLRAASHAAAPLHRQPPAVEDWDLRIEPQAQSGPGAGGPGPEQFYERSPEQPWPPQGADGYRRGYENPRAAGLDPAAFYRGVTALQVIGRLLVIVAAVLLAASVLLPWASLDFAGSSQSNSLVDAAGQSNNHYYLLQVLVFAAVILLGGAIRGLGAISAASARVWGGVTSLLLIFDLVYLFNALNHPDPNANGLFGSIAGISTTVSIGFYLAAVAAILVLIGVGLDSDPKPAR